MSSTAQGDKFSRLAALKPARKSRGSAAATRGYAPDIPEGSDRLAQLLGASTARTAFGEHLALRRWFPEPDEPENSPVSRVAMGLLAPNAPQEASDPRQWLFLDTETTGLAGGTGTYAFLIGIAWWDAGGLEVEQFFMREHSEEHSVLAALAERMAERRVLVTFNGKTFDWPLLDTRYRMARTVKTPAPRAHLDFLHPARQLWRMRIGSVRLADLERKILGWRREGDCFSELIPQYYFDFLRGGTPDPLVPVFYHNQMDLRGLAGISTRILEVVADPENHGTHALDLFGVSRLCERRGETTRARRLYSRSLEAQLPAEADRAARKSLALLAKRGGDWAGAVKLWESVAGDTREGWEAYRELAIHYEHRAHDPLRAAGIVRKALAELRRANRLGTMAAPAYRARRADFEHRLARLEKKAGRTLLERLEFESCPSAAESN
ncbi:MAG TPA: ribonuclease H-like domain-containing protein [Verrucomicrobiae bacterium]|nr:ribonuclease H-like domain-containing protein [Verrucomicrobiae bacterium]